MFGSNITKFYIIQFNLRYYSLDGSSCSQSLKSLLRLRGAGEGLLARPRYHFHKSNAPLDSHNETALRSGRASNLVNILNTLYIINDRKLLNSLLDTIEGYMSSNYLFSED